jgi:hypothetical protein
VREWSADVAVDERLVRQLVAGQFPEVELASLRLFAEGYGHHEGMTGVKLEALEGLERTVA